MKKATLTKHIGRVWQVATLEITKDGQILQSVTIDSFYKVTEEWFYEYDAAGGSGYGYKAGEVIRKIYIGDCEYEYKEDRD